MGFILGKQLLHKISHVIIMDPSRWMSQLSDNLKNIPVINLAIPGSHDSMTFTIKPTSNIAPDNERIVQILAKIFTKWTCKIIYKWCITQQLTVLEQLNAGIRYFDLRTSTKKSDEGYYFVHGLYGDEIATHLKAVKEFVEVESEEIIILDFQHFYMFGPNEHKCLIELIKSIFGEKLCPLPWDITTVTLAWMLGQGYRVIAIYRNDIASEDSKFWPGMRWQTPWPQTTSEKEMIHFLDATLAHRPRNAGFVSQCVLTPDIKFVLRNIFGDLRDKCSEPCFKAALPWLWQQKPGPSGINVVIADFVDINNEEFIQTVIALNDKLQR